MAEPEIIQKQRGILRDFRRAGPQRAQAETTAENRRKTELAEAETSYEKMRLYANEMLERADKAVEEAKRSTATVKLHYLFDETKPTPPVSSLEGDPERALTINVEAIEKTSKEVQSSVLELETWRAQKLARRRLLLGLGAIAFVILAIAGSFAFQAWQRNNELESRYQGALVALEKQEWDTARSELYKLIQLEQNYKDSQTLLRETWYGSAGQALQTGQWEKARSDLQALKNLDSNYKDARDLLRESYYRPAKSYLEMELWEKTRAELHALFLFDKEYKDTWTLLRETYYQPATRALEAKQWEIARTELLQLINLDTGYKDALSLFSRVD